MRQIAGEIGKAIGEAETAPTEVVAELTKALQASEGQLEKEFAKLPAVAGKDGKEIGRAYQQLLREIEQVRPSQTRLKTVDALVKELEQARRNLLGEISISVVPARPRSRGRSRASISVSPANCG
jgi:DNA polymerase/3'-5' exonuclease PolX